MNGGIKITLLAAGLTAAGCAATPNGVEVRPIADPASKLRPGADRLADAKGQLAIGNVGLALEAFRSVARLYPDNADAYIGMAACYEQMRRFDLAESKYEAALALDPRNPVLLARLAVALDQQGKTDEAVGVRGEIAAIRSASTALDNAQAEPMPAVAALAPAQTVAVALPKTPAPAPTVAAAPARMAASAQTVSVALPKVAAPASAPAQAPAPVTPPAPEQPAPVAPSNVQLALLAETRSKLTPEQLASGSQVDVAAEVMRPMNAAPLRDAAPYIAPPIAPLTREQLAAPTPVDMVAELMRRMNAAPLQASAPTIVQPVEPAPLPKAIATAHAPVTLGSAVAPRLERVSLGEVALLTGSGPVWRAPVAAAPQELTARWVPLNMASSRPTIRILNAARQQGLAAHNRNYLANLGWRKIAIGDATQVRQRSVVLYPASRPALGRRLAAQFGFRAQPTTTSDVFLVYLGRDAAGMRVAALKG